MASSRVEELYAQAMSRVAEAADNPPSRLSLRENFYRSYGYPILPQTFGFGNSEIAFLQWEIERGVLNPLTHERPGSEWWRKVNEHLILHAELAYLIANDGLKDPEDLSPCTKFWLEYIYEPSSKSWYRAHNACIVGGYLMFIEEARAESTYEQQFMNEVLIRLLYAQAMVNGKRYAFGKLGEVLSNPRLPSVKAIVHLPEFYPKHYPLTDADDDFVTHRGKWFMGRLEDFFDEVLISLHLRKLFGACARWLEEPRLERLLEHGKLIYPHVSV